MIRYLGCAATFTALMWFSSTVFFANVVVFLKLQSCVFLENKIEILVVSVALWFVRPSAIIVRVVLSALGPSVGTGRARRAQTAWQFILVPFDLFDRSMMITVLQVRRTWFWCSENTINHRCLVNDVERYHIRNRLIAATVFLKPFVFFCRQIS